MIEKSINHKAIKYRIYPTEKQKTMFLKTFGCCRKIWNLMLNDRIEYYQLTGNTLKPTPAQYKDKYPYLREVDSLALANVQLDLQEAYTKFFKEKKVGFPKFKSSKHCRKAYTTNNQKGSVAIVDKGIKLPKIGVVKAKLHRLPSSQWKVKGATVSLDSDNKFYVSVLFEYVTSNTPVSIDINNSIGLDYKSNGLYMDSKNNIGSNHKYYRESYNKLAKEQRKLSRMIESHIIDYKIIGNKRYPIYDKPLSECKNIQKQKIKVNKTHRKITNQRLDNLHKKSAEIANLYDVVCVENLDMKAIANKSFGNGKSTLDNGYGLFLNFLEYKLHDRGKLLIKIDKWFPSSQLCSCCGFKQKLSLKDRVYSCPNCGISIDRDYNAAINILNEGLRMIVA